jgi:RNA polymerase sigma factor (sigma-70 family)
MSNPGPVYDGAVLASAQAGDRDAILSLLESAQPNIRRYARKSCRLVEDAEEAVQETLLILYRRVGTLRTAASLSGWLFAIVRRECIRLGRLSSGMLPIDFENDARLARMPLDDLRLDLADCIQSLPQAYREVVLLRDVEVMTIDEIALRLSATRETVKARLHRARKLMREYLLS